MTEPLLSLRGVSLTYGSPRRDDGPWPAVDDVSFDVMPGQSIGLVGESGCGKSTLAKIAAWLLEPDLGDVLIEGRSVGGSSSALRALRDAVQIVFQDPAGAFNPRWRADRIIGESLFRANATRAETRDRCRSALEEVGLAAADLNRYPHEFSGGQRQRLAIARAIVARPRLVIADEPVSSLDVSVQAQILNLMLDLQDRDGLTWLLISHDLAVVAQAARHIVVLYAGRVVETGPTARVLAKPAHPYTRLLLESMPRPGFRAAWRRASGSGVPSAMVRSRIGCAFRHRCVNATERCATITPPTQPVAEAGGRTVSCHHPLVT